MTRTAPLLAALASMLLAPAGASARLGDLDATWAGDGVAELAAGTTLGAAAPGPGETVLAAGSSGSDLLVARFTAAGAPDATFGGGDGLATWLPAGTAGALADLALEPAGSAVVAGATTTTGVPTQYLGRVSVAGVPATIPLPARPTALTQATLTDVEVLADGRLAVAGWGVSIGADVMLVGRFTAGGGADPAFNAPGTENGWRLIGFGGGTEGRALALEVDAAGAMTVTGQVQSGGAAPVFQGAAARLTAAGAPDTAFGSGGQATYPGTSTFAGAAARGSDLLVGGTAGANGLLRRIAPGGGADGASSWPGAGEDIVATAGGGAVVAGRTGDGRLQTAWHTPAGGLDPGAAGVRVFDLPLATAGTTLGAAMAPGERLLVGATAATGGGVVARFAPNAAPAAALSAPPQVAAGAPVELTAAGSTDPEGEPLRYAFDLDGDGSFEFDGGANPLAFASFPAAGTVTLGVRVTDPRGASAIAQRAITVVDAGPRPQPVLGKQGVARPVRGVVRFKPPGAKRFVRMVELTAIPNGTVVDARKGRVLLTVLHDAAGGLDGARFHAGTFRFRQAKGREPITTLTLRGGSFAACRTAGAAGLRTLAVASSTARDTGSKKVRKLWGDGRGRFRTKGRYGSATVRGTKWLTADRCDGTFVRVVRGKVDVDDLVRQRRRDVRLRGGQKTLVEKP